MSKQGGKLDILCIDDDQDFLDSVRPILEAEGYAVRHANSAEEGLRLYRQSRPDLVIVDLMMEEVDSGIGFVKEVKALGNTPPLYLLSSVGDNLTTNTDYSALGLAGVFQKPIHPRTLASTLRMRLKG